MKIGIYGGTFDPPHLGHLYAAQAAAATLDLDRLLLIPAGLPPHKELAAASASGTDRLAMAAQMADGLDLMTGRPGFAQADPIELERAGKSYTADTLAALRARYPGDELWLLVGTDMFLTLQNWYQPEQILSLAHVAAFARTETDSAEAMKIQADFLRDRFGARVTLVQLPRITDVSSTQMRALLRENRAQARELLWSQVYGYILRRGLYGVEADLAALDNADLRQVSYSMVKAKRIPHIRGCEEEAVRLARRWGGDPELARRAGILHDCTKYLELEEHLAICDRYQIPLDDLERRTVKLLHAKSGAALAKYEFGQPEEIFRAIYYHTTGGGEMDLLSKILYMADYIEPTRAPFEGLEEMRRLAYEDLDAALLLGCEITIQDMESRNMEVHTNTLQMRDSLKGRSQ